jgi:hypothetical protein
MTNQINLNQQGLQLLSFEELTSLNGGDGIIDKNSNAYKWGQEVRKAVDNVILGLFFL